MFIRDFGVTIVSYVAFKMAALWFWTMFNCNPPIAHCHPLLWGGGILVDHWSTISSLLWCIKFELNWIGIERKWIELELNWKILNPIWIGIELNWKIQNPTWIGIELNWKKWIDPSPDPHNSTMRASFLWVQNLIYALLLSSQCCM